MEITITATYVIEANTKAELEARKSNYLREMENYGHTGVKSKSRLLRQKGK